MLVVGIKETRIRMLKILDDMFLVENVFIIKGINNKRKIHDIYFLIESVSRTKPW